MTSRVDAIKAAWRTIREGAFVRHRRGEDPFDVTAGFSDGVDTLLRELFAEVVGDEAASVAMLAVGGYGRRELCPRSDVDLLFVREKGYAAERVERLIRLLWDGGFQLGHAVRTPDECYEYMCDDLSTANAMLESRFLAGSRSLHDAFLSQGPLRYRRRHKDKFVSTKLQLIRQSIEDPQRTIYVVEPNLKEGACTLRDIQRVLWVENMRHGGGVGFETLLQEDRLPGDEVSRLREGYAFYLRVRCEIHFTNNVRQDILERDSALSISRGLGYGKGLDDQKAVEALMGDYYRHARQVYRFLRYYVEEGTEPAGLLSRFFRGRSTEKVRPHLLLRDGRLSLAGTPQMDDDSGPWSVAEWILDVFLVAQERDAVLSQALCDWIRRGAARVEALAFQSPQAIRSLRQILQRGKHCGRLLKAMHETDVLGRMVPEFGALTCLVGYDGHHQFTADEHTLRTLEELDRIEQNPGYPEPEFRRVLLEIKDPFPLRVALLLHDTGKVAPGDHSVSGTEAATLICERLGLDEATTHAVDFLVYRHLELSRISELRDFNEEGVIESLARLVEREERLRMLYLFTYIDIVSVGPGTWTRWKGAQLSELYQRTMIHLRTGGVAGDGLEAALTSPCIDPHERQEVLEHCGRMESTAYAREILPERMLYHLELVGAFLDRREMQVALESRLGYYEITFCGGDRPRLFADLTGLLFSEGFNVLGARIYSRRDGVVIDLFQVEVADTVQLGVEERTERIRKKLRKIETKKQMVDDFIRQRTLSYRPARWRKPLYGPSVSFDNESSPTCTVIEVSAGDRPGLLYDLAHAIHRLGLDLRTAKVSTLTDRAHDAFYVVERDGGKVDNPARRTEIVEGLKASAQSPAGVLRR